MAEKTNHHVVPQFYLRSFADGVGRKARLIAFEKESGRSFKTAVRNVGAERHFNRIEAYNGQDPNALENELAEIEAEWAPSFKDVVEAGTFRSIEHRQAIMALVATMSLRSGRFRETIRGVVTETQTQPHTQTDLIRHEIRPLHQVCECLDRRNWCFIRPMTGNKFITSDDPAMLHWVEERDRGFWHSPGHGVAGTAVTFPLSPALLMFGTFEPQPTQNIISDDEAAQFNGLIAGHARRHFFARDMGFTIGMGEHGVQPATEIARLKRRAGR